ncbi:hypothetical protein DFH05DRAFT_1531131 [Lentinula detonsa]|uniref:Uncharacterized protein n=1 Tax=Lentinula detonsa TaxID=2804962 RepID=A0A9W8TSM7_9AGAR|nr:hypothetical protein DFH05DRAFT_1531131 [Lentinula detonsa]
MLLLPFIAGSTSGMADTSSDSETDSAMSDYYTGNDNPQENTQENPPQDPSQNRSVSTASHNSQSGQFAPGTPNVPQGPVQPPRTPPAQMGQTLDIFGPPVGDNDSTTPTPRAIGFGFSRIQPPVSPMAPPSKRRRGGRFLQDQPGQSSDQGNDHTNNESLGNQELLMRNLSDAIYSSHAEMMRKQDDKIDKLTQRIESSSDVLCRVVEALDLRNKGRPLRGNMDSDEGVSSLGLQQESEQRRNSNVAGSRSHEERNISPFDYASRTTGSRSGAVKHRSPQELRDKACGYNFDLKELMRYWWNDIMQGRNLAENEVSREEAENFAKLYKANPLARPCTVDDFRYWLAGGPKSEWNQAASYVFIEILEQKRLITTPDASMHDALREAFHVRLKSLHKTWLAKLKMEVDADEPHTGKPKTWQRKYTRRRDVVIAIPALNPYLEDFDQLGTGGMSSDEEDPGMSKPSMAYNIREPKWRSEEVKRWLRLLDYVHLESRCSTEGFQFRFSRGAPPRLRVDNNNKTSTAKYVRGLPSNFYDAGWLEAMEPGWSKSGSGFVNLVIRPKNSRKLTFPEDLSRALEARKYPSSSVE